MPAHLPLRARSRLPYCLGDLNSAMRRPRRHVVVDPTLRVERSFWRQGLSRVVGIDECGVAALSGPVVACALYMPINCRKIPGVRDSKMLSRAERERLADADLLQSHPRRHWRGQRARNRAPEHPARDAPGHAPGARPRRRVRPRHHRRQPDPRRGHGSAHVHRARRCERVHHRRRVGRRQSLPRPT